MVPSRSSVALHIEVAWDIKRERYVDDGCVEIPGKSRARSFSLQQRKVLIIGVPGKTRWRVSRHTIRAHHIRQMYAISASVNAPVLRSMVALMRFPLSKGR